MYSRDGGSFATSCDPNHDFRIDSTEKAGHRGEAYTETKSIDTLPSAGMPKADAFGFGRNLSFI